MLTFATPYHRRLTWRYIMLFITIGMTGGLLGPALPHLADSVNASMSQIAVLFTARAIGNMSGSFVTGLLLDRLDGHRVLLGMGAILVAGLLIAPLSPVLVVLAGVFGLLGFAEMSLNSGGNTLLILLHRENSAPHISALHFCFSLGNMLTPLLMVAVLWLTGEFHWIFWLVSLFALMALMPLTRLESPRRLPLDGSTPETVSYKHRDGLLLAIFIATFAVYVGMEITFAGWITTYGALVGLPAKEAAILATLFWLALSAGRLAAIPLLRFLAPWWVLSSCITLALATSWALHTAWIPLMAGSLLFGLAVSAFFPTLYALCNQVMEMRGKTTGAVFTAAGSGALIVPSLTGPLLDRLGAGAFPLLLAGLSVLVITGLSLLALRLRLLQKGVVLRKASSAASAGVD